MFKRTSLVMVLLILAVAIFGFAVFSLFGGQQSAQTPQTIIISPGQKVMSVSAPNGTPYILTRPMASGEMPETYTFEHYSGSNQAYHTWTISEQAAK